MSESITPTADPRELLAGLPPDEPVVMINLLKFRPDGGAASYARYAAGVEPHMQQVGAVLLYAGDAKASLIGSTERTWWDTILVVRYPTPAAFLKMVSDEDYLKVHEHRAAALERAELIATNAGLGSGRR
jgi:uncharacterized protein (DUF1330 family)